MIGSTITLFQGNRGNTDQHNRGTAIAVKPTITPTLSLTPLFSDNFLDNDKGWSIGDVADYTRHVGNGKLTLMSTNHKILIESLPTSALFNDFSVTVDLTILRADGHDRAGLYVRGDSNLDHDYRLDILGNMTYAINKESLDTKNNVQTISLVDPTHTSALKPIGRENTLTVIMKGSILVLQINGTVVDSVADTDYTQGQIALFVENGKTSDSVAATFSDIVIYPAPDLLPR